MSFKSKEGDCALRRVPCSPILSHPKCGIPVHVHPKCERRLTVHCPRQELMLWNGVPPHPPPPVPGASGVPVLLVLYLCEPLCEHRGAFVVGCPLPSPSFCAWCERCPYLSYISVNATWCGM
eukprot:scaffold8023_cov103-Isochrysis_galbana.AAC.26